MANTNPVSLCPHCRVELPYPIPRQCPHCFLMVRAEPNKFFSSPNYLMFQFDNLVNESGALKDGASDTEINRVHEIRNALTLWARSCTHQDRVLSFKDTLYLAKEMLHSNTRGVQLNELVRIGKQIGSLCDKIDAYINSGGAINPLPVIVRPEDSTKEKALEGNDFL